MLVALFTWTAALSLTSGKKTFYTHTHIHICCLVKLQKYSLNKEYTMLLDTLGSTVSMTINTKNHRDIYGCPSCLYICRLSPKCKHHGRSVANKWSGVLSQNKWIKSCAFINGNGKGGNSKKSAFLVFLQLCADKALAVQWLSQKRTFHSPATLCHLPTDAEHRPY